MSMQTDPDVGAQPSPPTKQDASSPDDEERSIQDAGTVSPSDRAIELLDGNPSTRSSNTENFNGPRREAELWEPAMNRNKGKENVPRVQSTTETAKERNVDIVSLLPKHEDTTGFPPGRERRSAEDKGRTHHVDHNTRSTTCVPPSGAGPSQPSQSRDSADKGRTYHVDHETHSNKWIPPSGSGPLQRSESTKTISRYKTRLLKAAEDASTSWKPPSHSGTPRSVLIKADEEEWHNGLDLLELKNELNRAAQQEVEHVCIIENITESWLIALGAHLNLPPTFVLYHADTDFKFWFTKFDLMDLVDQYFRLVDDSTERLFRLTKRLISGDNKTLSRDRETLLLQDCETLLPLLDDLSRRSKLTRSIISQWMLSSVPDNDQQRLSSELERMRRVYDDLKMADGIPQSYRTSQMLESVRVIDDSLKIFAATESKCWYSIPFFLQREGATTSTGEFDFHEHDQPCSFSYIRVHKWLLLVLLDYRPDDITHGPSPREHSGPYWRDQLHMYFPQIGSGGGSRMIVPRLFGTTGDAFEALKEFAYRTWHLDILCGEEEMPLPFERMTYPGYLSAKRSYAALAPRAFLYLISSFIWGQNMVFLENKGKRISFCDIRKIESLGATKINAELSDCREDLDYLIESVTYVDSQTPADLAAYFDEFPRIRWRHGVTYLSPIDHHKNILSRARTLEKLLIDSFQMLMSSVSVQQAAISVQQAKVTNEQASLSNEQATLSNQQAAVTNRLAEDSAKQASASAEQARAATRITALAFVYIPLTFVTGIFGMNIRTGAEAPNGFIWYAPIVTLVVAILFTVALWYTADWVETRLAARQEKRKSDVEGGYDAKAKAE